MTYQDVINLSVKLVKKNSYAFYDEIDHQLQNNILCSVEASENAKTDAYTTDQSLCLMAWYDYDGSEAYPKFKDMLE
jgi:hypothetical protein